MSNEIEQAKDLYENIQRCLKIFNNVKYPYKESEVQFRHETVRGVLLIASSDVWEMIQNWQNE